MALVGKLKDNCFVKDDSDCVMVCEDDMVMIDSECSYCKKRCDCGGVETWWGLCYVWVFAVMFEEEL